MVAKAPGPEPTANTSEGPLPHTPKRESVVPELMDDQLAPSKCRMAPPNPTAKTSAGRPPHPPQREPGVAEPMDDHHAPQKCRMAPPVVPTAKTSAGPLPQTPSRLALPKFIGDHSDLQSGLHPSPATVLPSSQISPSIASTTPLPQPSGTQIPLRQMPWGVSA